jgi:hypothetical protein
MRFIPHFRVSGISPRRRPRSRARHRVPNPARARRRPRPRFLRRQQTEDDDEHEYDSTIRKFARLNRARGRPSSSISSPPADRGRRRPRVRSGNSRALIVLVVDLRPRFLHCQQTEDDDEHEYDSTIRKFARLNRARGRPDDDDRVRSGNSRALIVLVVVLRPRFLHRQQTEDDDDHEHDQKIPARPRRIGTRTLKRPDQTFVGICLGEIRLKIRINCQASEYNPDCVGPTPSACPCLEGHLVPPRPSRRNLAP